jgi:hypothetical protein
MTRRLLSLACGVFFIVVFGTPMANAQNLLMNQEIDAEIRPWAAAVGTAEWNSFDYLGAGDSGSILAIIGDVGASIVSECVSILREENYALPGEFWVASSQTGGILFQAMWYDDPMCTNFIRVSVRHKCQGRRYRLACWAGELTWFHDGCDGEQTVNKRVRSLLRGMKR